MNRWLMVLSLACVLMLAPGCKRRDAEEPREYDPDLDGSPTATQVLLDPNVSADQRVLARAVEDARLLPPQEAPASQPTGGEAKPAKIKGLFDDAGSFLKNLGKGTSRPAAAAVRKHR